MFTFEVDAVAETAGDSVEVPDLGSSNLLLVAQDGATQVLEDVDLSSGRRSRSISVVTMTHRQVTNCGSFALESPRWAAQRFMALRLTSKLRNDRRRQQPAQKLATAPITKLARVTSKVTNNVGRTA